MEKPPQDEVARMVRDILAGEPLTVAIRGIRNGQAIVAEQLGAAYESILSKPGKNGTPRRKSSGIYYTPTSLVQQIVTRTVGELVHRTRGRDGLTILDPACGCGSFLLAAYQSLLDAHKQRKGRSLSLAERARILLGSIHGVDADPHAVDLTRAALLLKMVEDTGELAADIPDLADNIRCGNALIGPDFKRPPARHFAPDCPPFDWTAFPEIEKGGGFDAVIGNPPWGQKEIDKNPVVKRYLRERFPSSVGIHDLFRPFVELGVRLTANRGYFGMVLPDIVLLKNYQPTRRFLLDQLALTAIDWWGQAFPEAVIDAATIIGVKELASPKHRMTVAVHDPKRAMQHSIPQADFAANPRQVFNLYLTAARRRLLNRLASFPRLGELFEIHEGVHSGNLRAELFVRKAVDESCRELYFGRDEITPYSLEWKGWHVRLAAVPSRKTRECYANLGKSEWHEQEKVLVRRTGDRVLAALDRTGRYASNNYFLVFPKRPCDLDLDGLCALLNSRFMTWYFRTIEPRQGRVFAELKIKHLREFPLPAFGLELNDLGARRALVSCQPALDHQIDRAVCQVFAIHLGELENSV